MIINFSTTFWIAKDPSCSTTIRIAKDRSFGSKETVVLRRWERNMNIWFYQKN